MPTSDISQNRKEREQALQEEYLAELDRVQERHREEARHKSNQTIWDDGLKRERNIVDAIPKASPNESPGRQ